MQDVYKILMNIILVKNIMLIAFDNTIVDMIDNKKLSSIVTELFVRGRELKISLVFIMQSYFKFPKS